MKPLFKKNNNHYRQDIIHNNINEIEIDISKSKIDESSNYITNGNKEETNKKEKKVKFSSFLYKYINKHCFNFIESKKYNNIIVNSIIFFIFLHSFIFLNAILFSDKNIIEINAYKKKKIEYLITREYDTIFYTIVLLIFIIKILNWLLKEQEDLESIYIYKFYFGLILIFLLHC